MGNYQTVALSEGDTLSVGDHIEIKINELSFSTVRIGIDAPKDVKILRKEIEHSEKVKSQKDEITSEQEFRETTSENFIDF